MINELQKYFNVPQTKKLFISVAKLKNINIINSNNIYLIRCFSVHTL